MLKVAPGKGLVTEIGAGIHVATCAPAFTHFTCRIEKVTSAFVVSLENSVIQ